MKAPDKIYLTTSAENEKYGNNWGCWTTRECPGEPYIRKEALLEWAKNWKKLGQSNDFMYAMEILVQHLNSM